MRDKSLGGNPVVTGMAVFNPPPFTIYVIRSFVSCFLDSAPIFATQFLIIISISWGLPLVFLRSIFKNLIA